MSLGSVIDDLAQGKLPGGAGGPQQKAQSGQSTTENEGEPI
jgi:hypothetical protein